MFRMFEVCGNDMQQHSNLQSRMDPHDFLSISRT